MAKDFFHVIVKEILIADGWIITHDPYELRGYDPAWEIDFGAEKIIAAERGLIKIAVEVTSFLETSFAYEFHRVLGQYLNYRSGLLRVDPDRKLVVAIPIEIFETEFDRVGVVNSIEDYDMKFMIYDPLDKSIVRWKI